MNILNETGSDLDPSLLKRQSTGSRPEVYYLFNNKKKSETIILAELHSKMYQFF